MSVLDKEYRVKMSNGVVMGVPVRIIAINRAKYYAEVDGVDFETSLMEDTVPMFAGNEYEIEDWARNNMDWIEVKDVARIVSMPDHQDEIYQDGWINPENVEVVNENT